MSQVLGKRERPKFGDAESSHRGVRCVSCSSRRVRLIGRIPPSNNFAGRILDRMLPGGFLWICEDCHLGFRYPRPEKSTIDALYRDGSHNSWPDVADTRVDWQLIATSLTSNSAITSVLDVGCFDGRLLEFLGPRYRWMGIEINEEAVRRAEERGVRVLGNDFETIGTINISADAVIAVDVIEHSEDPRRFLEQLARSVRPGGIVIVTSGNTDARTWRLMGSRYWYCHIAEHVSFINPRWAEGVSRSCGLTVIQTERFSHATGRRAFGRLARELALNLAYRVLPQLLALARKRGFGGIDVQRHPELANSPPYWMTAKDHFMVVFRKSA